MLRKTVFVFFTVIILAFCISCSPEEDIKPQSTSINKIMPLGASRVQGETPTYESFRYELWKDLKDGNWTFDFIGSAIDNGSYATYNGNEFDLDHEGHGGATSGEILSNLDDWLAQTGSPDIVLLSSPGGNDGLQNLSYQDALSNIEAILDKLQTNNPEVTIILELMAPAHSSAMTSDLETFMNNMNTDIPILATQKSNGSSQVLTVDMHTGFTDDMLADDVHYNSNGAAFIAERYYNVLSTVLEQ